MHGKVSLFVKHLVLGIISGFIGIFASVCANWIDKDDWGMIVLLFLMLSIAVLMEACVAVILVSKEESQMQAFQQKQATDRYMAITSGGSDELVDVNPIDL